MKHMRFLAKMGLKHGLKRGMCTVMIMGFMVLTANVGVFAQAGKINPNGDWLSAHTYCGAYRNWDCLLSIKGTSASLTEVRGKNETVTELKVEIQQNAVKFIYANGSERVVPFTDKTDSFALGNVRFIRADAAVKKTTKDQLRAIMAGDFYMNGDKEPTPNYTFHPFQTEYGNGKLTNAYDKHKWNEEDTWTPNDDGASVYCIEDGEAKTLLVFVFETFVVFKKPPDLLGAEYFYIKWL